MSQNKWNEISFTAEPLEPELFWDLENGVSIESMSYDERVKYLSNFGWDEYTAGYCVWASTFDFNVLLDFTLASETDS